MSKNTCSHGQLQRQCALCEKDDAIRLLKRQCDELHQLNKRQQRTIKELEAIRANLSWCCDSYQDQVREKDEEIKRLSEQLNLANIDALTLLADADSD